MSFALDDVKWRNDILDYVNKHMPAEIEKELYKIANGFLRDVKSVTPVKTGHLRNNWFISNVIRVGDSYFIEVFNNVEYAAPVEYGHRSRQGKQSVSGLKKRPKKSFIPGKFMMTTSLEELKKNLPRELQKWLDDMVKIMIG